MCDLRQFFYTPAQKPCTSHAWIFNSTFFKQCNRWSTAITSVMHKLSHTLYFHYGISKLCFILNKYDYMISPNLTPLASRETTCNIQDCIDHLQSTSWSWTWLHQWTSWSIQACSPGIVQGLPCFLEEVTSYMESIIQFLRRDQISGQTKWIFI